MLSRSTSRSISSITERAKFLPRSGPFVESIIFGNIYVFLATKFNGNSGKSPHHSVAQHQIWDQLVNIPTSSRRSASMGAWEFLCNVGRDLSYLGPFCIRGVIFPFLSPQQLASKMGFSLLILVGLWLVQAMSAGKWRRKVPVLKPSQANLDCIGSLMLKIETSI